MNTSISEADFLRLVTQNKGIINKVCTLYGHSMQHRQDLRQDIIVQLWRSFPQYRGEAKISTWMYRIALNTAISDLRKQKRSIDPVELNREIPESETEESNEQSERWKTVQKAIEGLSQVEKAVVMLYLDERSYEEMQDVLGISQNTLRVKMNRIKEKLRKYVQTER